MSTTKCSWWRPATISSQAAAMAAADRGVQRAEVAVGQRCRLLDHRERPHELGEVRERYAGDREVLERPGGMDAPDRLPRQLLRAERVGFGSEIGHRCELL
jgi:hypothetical protein